MIRTLILFLTLGALAACGMHTNNDPSQMAKATPTQHKALSLVPQPAFVEHRLGYLNLSTSVNVKIRHDTPDSEYALLALLDSLNIKQDKNDSVAIYLQLDDSLGLGDEGYQLLIDNNVTLSAATDTGLFYAVQTLRQLLPVKASTEYKLPKLNIRDEPQYAWRGSMLDVARNFFSIDYLKQHIERIALFKLNKLHLHLTDDQGWRIEIKSWPKLATVGGSTQVNGGVGGYYTQEQMHDLVKFAARHQIELIPEIDLPGHTQAAIAAYNELACDSVIFSQPQNKCDDVVGPQRLALYEGTCVGFSALCTSEKPDLVYGFVEDVLREIAHIFPSKYLHIGGDEVLNEEAAAFPAFITEVDRIVASLGRETLAWEEASAGDIRASSLLQFWNDDYDISSALEKGIHLVLSPCSFTYLDHGNYNGQPGAYTWCRAEGIPLQRVYSLVPENYKQVIGVEAAMWSEAVPNDATADNRNWPRLAAISEVAWSTQNNRDYDAFTRRLSALRAHLDQLGIEYYKEPQLGWE